MSEAKGKENIDCYGSGNPSQDQLEAPLVVKLVELSRLNKDIQMNSFILLYLPGVSGRFWRG